MDIRILFLGELGDRFGREHVLAAADGLTVGEVRQRLIADIDGAGPALSRPDVRLAVDQAVMPDSAVVRAGQEVAVLPIFSGG